MKRDKGSLSVWEVNLKFHLNRICILEASSIAKQRSAK